MASLSLILSLSLLLSLLTAIDGKRSQQAYLPTSIGVTAETVRSLAIDQTLYDVVMYYDNEYGEGEDRGGEWVRGMGEKRKKEEGRKMELGEGKGKRVKIFFELDYVTDLLTSSAQMRSKEGWWTRGCLRFGIPFSQIIGTRYLVTHAHIPMHTFPNTREIIPSSLIGH